jgi:glycine dehydrogenase subunit 1
MAFFPADENERKEMLGALGAQSFEELIRAIPEDMCIDRPLDLPPRLSEYEVLNELQRLSDANTQSRAVSFLGGGSYDHFIPTAVAAITGRSEFYTAYTPYQAEVSQGTLQTIYEYQSMICELTGMDVSNASMYDGGSSLAEAVLLSAGHTKRNNVVVAGALHPNYRAIVGTYCRNQNISIAEVPHRNGCVDPDELESAVNDSTAAVIVQQPNFFGCLEDVHRIGETAKASGALYIAVVNPISLGILTPPGEYSADIVVGEGQPLGVALNYGGPYLGIFAARQDLIRKIPGRLAGITVDADGRRGFVLTLQTREQQIRRERATSNICTNQGLMMLAATVYMTLMGRRGIQEVARLCMQKSHYLADRIGGIAGCRITYDRPFFNEFVVTLPRPAAGVTQILADRGILAGIPLNRWEGTAGELMIAVTEKRTKQEMDIFVEELERAVMA